MYQPHVSYRSHHGHRHKCGCEYYHCKCGCECYHCGCEDNLFSRRFITRQERLEKLEEYRDQLKQELKGVEEHIQSLKS